jgi:hypothetical protein
VVAELLLSQIVYVDRSRDLLRRQKEPWFSSIDRIPRPRQAQPLDIA